MKCIERLAARFDRWLIATWAVAFAGLWLFMVGAIIADVWN